MAIKSHIYQHLKSALAEWQGSRGIPELPPFTLEEPPKNIPADLSTNVAMQLAKQLKTNPRKLAEEIAAVIRERMADAVASVEIAGAGFLNLRLSDAFLAAGLNGIIAERDSFGREEQAARRVLIEFVSANPTGPLHIGHGRGAAIGDSLARIYARRGYAVEREYYINDVGNQMNMLGLSLEARYRELLGEKTEFPQDGYKGDYIKDIARKLIDSKRPASEIDFKQEALNAMMATIDKDLIEFGVKFDHWFSEGTIAKDRDPKTGRTKVEEVCERLLKEGFAFEQEGALWLASTRYGDDKDRVLRRSDGRYTYLASDVAYHEEKISRGYGKLLDLWGADHHGYVPRMKAAMQMLGAPEDRLQIILYQLVSLVRNGVPVAMSTRAGEFVTLEEVLHEVGRDACRFFFMLRAPDSPLEFDLELAKKQSSDNPVFYVQYVHARCNSIFREFGTRFPGEPRSPGDPKLLAAPEERTLVKKLLFFPDVLELCIKTNSPHHLTVYLMETADAFHRFYEECRVLVDDRALMQARLTLVEAVAVVIRNGLNLLGVSAPEKM